MVRRSADAGARTSRSRREFLRRANKLNVTGRPQQLGYQWTFVTRPRDHVPSLVTECRRLPPLPYSVCAVIAGAKSFVAIAGWAADAPPHLLTRLGVDNGSHTC